MNYQDVYPELVNKLRWAIATSFRTPESNYNFSAAQRIATVFSQDIVALVKAAEEQPGIIGSTATIRGTLTQLSVESTS